MGTPKIRKLRSIRKRDQKFQGNRRGTPAFCVIFMTVGVPLYFDSHGINYQEYDIFHLKHLKN